MVMACWLFDGAKILYIMVAAFSLVVCLAFRRVTFMLKASRWRIAF